MDGVSCVGLSAWADGRGMYAVCFRGVWTRMVVHWMVLLPSLPPLLSFFSCAFSSCLPFEKTMYSLDTGEASCPPTPPPFPRHSPATPYVTRVGGNDGWTHVHAEGVDASAGGQGGCGGVSGRVLRAVL